MAEINSFEKGFVSTAVNHLKSAQLKQNSTQMEKMGLTYENDSKHIKRLYDFLEEQGIERESLDEDQLRGIYAIIGTATKGENAALGKDKVVCIVNLINSEKTKSESGHFKDIAVATLDENGKVESEIKIDPKIIAEYEKEYERQFGTKSGERYPVRTINDLAKFASNDKLKFLCQNREDFVKLFGEQEVQDRENLGIQDQKNGSPNAVGKAPHEKKMDEAEQNDYQVRYERGKAICKAAGMNVEAIEAGNAADFNFANVTGALKIKDTTELNKKLPGQKLVEGTHGIAVQCLDTGDDSTKSYTNFMFIGDSTVPTNDGSNDSYLNEEFEKKRGSDKAIEETTNDKSDDVEFGKSTTLQTDVDLNNNDPQLAAYIQVKLDKIMEQLKKEVAEAYSSPYQAHVKEEDMGDAYGNAYASICQLEQETGVDLSEVSDQLLGKAEENYEHADMHALAGFALGDGFEERIASDDQERQLGDLSLPNNYH